ncbi:SDR family oxidoreductase [Salinibacterium sp. dk2585]|uniref:SDR family NAD(P)-dependent oxidoreductase n=1 Tax=unclassified Salinibacterium TaxID=2632331 RepID=UPI0011C24DC6|nr:MULTISPECIES: SDR family NAD(P)-dependent oxidoreductase [unclassified Salinibacterium]QEE62320.1 SDR family oxidoreductase [Salinibacterium sp. dk2585]TXK53671.1 SDR family oxidoreductase [Salinibacterium sp. dk5596]
MLSNKKAIITGGSSGIGAAIARLFVENGAAVALLDRNVSAGEALAAELGTASFALEVDVADAAGVERAVDGAVARLGGLDILVNAAGVLGEKPIAEMSVEEFDRVVDINLRGTFITIRYAVRHFDAERGGRIINLASQLGIKGGTPMAHYVASKAGVIGMTKALALELAPQGILVNAIAPGPIDTPLLDNVSAEWRAGKQAELPLGRFGTPEEVAPTALLLASSPGGNIYVGQTLGPNSGDVMP